MKTFIKKLFLLSFLLTTIVLSGQEIDSVVTNVDATISLTPTTDPSKKVDGPKGRRLFYMLNNRVKMVEANGVKNSVVDISSILTATGNTPYAGKFVRENGSVRITCFIDKQGNKHAFEGGVQSVSAGPNVQVYNNGAGNYTIEANDSQILSFNSATKVLTIQRGGSVALPFASQADLDSTKYKINYVDSTKLTKGGDVINKTLTFGTKNAQKVEILTRDTARILIDMFGNVGINASPSTQFGLNVTRSMRVLGQGVGSAFLIYENPNLAVRQTFFSHVPGVAIRTDLTQDPLTGEFTIDSDSGGNKGGIIVLKTYNNEFFRFRQTHAETAKDIYITSAQKGIIQKSLNGACWKLNISDMGVITAVATICPN